MLNLILDTNVGLWICNHVIFAHLTRLLLNKISSGLEEKETLKTRELLISLESRRNKLDLFFSRFVMRDGTNERNESIISYDMEVSNDNSNEDNTKDLPSSVSSGTESKPNQAWEWNGKGGVSFTLYLNCTWYYLALIWTAWLKSKNWIIWASWRGVRTCIFACKSGQTCASLKVEQKWEMELAPLFWRISSFPIPRLWFLFIPFFPPVDIDVAFVFGFKNPCTFIWVGLQVPCTDDSVLDFLPFCYHCKESPVSSVFIARIWALDPLSSTIFNDR